MDVLTDLFSIIFTVTLLVKSNISRLRNNSLSPNSSRLKNYSDATLTVLSALNNPIVRIKFTNVFPITLNDIGFDTSLSADTIITADATFMYDYYEFEEIN